MADCLASSVRNRAIFSGLRAEELAMFGKIGRRQHVKAGHMLMREGNDALVVANILEGVLKLVVLRIGWRRIR